MKPFLPVYQHPTLAVLVDDSPSFIANLEFQIGSALAVKSFQKADAALQWIRARASDDRNKQLSTGASYDEHTLSPEHATFLLGIDQIYRTVTDPGRFYLPAVVIVDYAMPRMTGLDFCRQLAGLPCKKILFTGEADETIAVDAFNKGLIDRYLKKSDPRAADLLESEIAALEQAYFADRFGMVKDQQLRHTCSFLSDEAFIGLVGALRKQHGFVEHFLLSNPPGVLFFDADGNPALMVVETRDGLISHLEAAQAYGAPQALQDALRNRTVVPFFWKSGGLYTDLIEHWEQHCKPPQVCLGREAYYWALFDLPETFRSRPVYPYNRFLHDRAWLTDPYPPQ